MTGAGVMTQPVAISVDVIVDARHLVCPLPVLKAQKALRGMASGQRLRVLSTDPRSATEFSLFAAESGLTVAAIETIAGGGWSIDLLLGDNLQ